MFWVMRWKHSNNPQVCLFFFLFVFFLPRVQRRTPHVYLLRFETKVPVKCKTQFLNIVLVLSEIAAAPVKRLRGGSRRGWRPCPASGSPAGLEASGDVGGSLQEESSVPMLFHVSVFLWTNFFCISRNFVRLGCLSFIIALSNQEQAIN